VAPPEGRGAARFAISVLVTSFAASVGGMARRSAAPN
jgi:hypothetical protein